LNFQQPSGTPQPPDNDRAGAPNQEYDAAPIERRATLEMQALTANRGTDEDRVIGRSYDELPQPAIPARQSFLREMMETLLLVVAIFTLVNLSTARFVVEGSSMEPNFQTDEFVIVSRLAYIIGEPERGDVVVFHYDEDTNRDFIKRIVGLPGEYIEVIDGRVHVNGVILAEPYIETFCNCRDRDWLLGEDEFFVLGDNRNSSQDSFDFGPIDRDQIVGRAWIRYWPPEAWRIIPHHDYDIPAAIPSEVPARDDNNEPDAGDLEEIPFYDSFSPGSF
jgi:signal peptidase I